MQSSHCPRALCWSKLVLQCLCVSVLCYRLPLQSIIIVAARWCLPGLLLVDTIVYYILLHTAAFIASSVLRCTLFHVIVPDAACIS